MFGVGLIIRRGGARTGWGRPSRNDDSGLCSRIRHATSAACLVTNLFDVDIKTFALKQEGDTWLVPARDGSGVQEFTSGPLCSSGRQTEGSTLDFFSKRWWYWLVLQQKGLGHQRSSTEEISCPSLPKCFNTTFVVYCFLSRAPST